MCALQRSQHAHAIILFDLTPENLGHDRDLRSSGSVIQTAGNVAEASENSLCHTVLTGINCVIDYRNEQVMGQQSLQNFVSIELDLNSIEKTDNALRNSREVAVARVVDNRLVTPPKVRFHRQ
jgi:hypothetical protein